MKTRSIHLKSRPAVSVHNYSSLHTHTKYLYNVALLDIAPFSARAHFLHDDGYPTGTENLQILVQ